MVAEETGNRDRKTLLARHLSVKHKKRRSNFQCKFAKIRHCVANDESCEKMRCYKNALFDDEVLTQLDIVFYCICTLILPNQWVFKKKIKISKQIIRNRITVVGAQSSFYFVSIKKRFDEFISFVRCFRWEKLNFVFCLSNDIEVKKYIKNRLL